MRVQRVEVKSEPRVQEKQQHGQAAQRLAQHIAHGDAVRAVQRQRKGLKDDQIIENAVEGVHAQRDADAELRSAAAFEHGGEGGQQRRKDRIADNQFKIVRRFFEEVAAQPWKLENLLPRPLVAGTPAGTLTAEGAKLLDPTGTLQPGVVLAPPEGDAGTGMVATNSVRVRTGNVSAGTSIFAMVVLEHKLARLHPEVDLVTTPAGDLAGMSHANNFTSDLNAWVGLFGQFAAAIGQPVDAGTLYGTLFRAAIADDVDADCGGLLNYPFRSGEFLAGLPEGRPLFARSPEARMSLGNFMRTQLFSAFSPVKIGMDVMTKDEGVAVDSLVGHGGIFTTPKVAQKILAAAFDTPIKVMATAAEGGAWGMAVLADYLWHAGQPLADYLDARVFADAASTTEAPDANDVAGFEAFFDRFRKGLPIEHASIENIPLETK